MKNLSKIISIVCVLCMSVSVLAGCQSGKKEVNQGKEVNQVIEKKGENATVTEDAGISGKLVIWEHTPQFEKPLKNLIEGFKVMYPNTEIEYQIKTSNQYYNLLATAIQAGEAPDLFWTNGTATTNLGAYVDQGVIMDITDVVDFSLFDDNAKKLVTINDKIYASPTAEVGGRAVFYNKDIFENLGLEVPKTFSEFEALLPKINEAGIIPISFSGSDPWAALFHFEPVLAAMSLDWIQEYLDGKEVQVNDHYREKCWGVSFL